MIELICAMMGGKHCGWCTYKPPSWWDRLWRFDQLLKDKERPWYERAVWAVQEFFLLKIRIWRLGKMWHNRYHV